MASPPDALLFDAADLPERPDDPVATALTTAALAPYIGLLPGAVLDDFAFLMEVMLAQHPVGAVLIARLTPGLDPGDQTTPVPQDPDFQGYPTVRILRAQLARVRTAPGASGDPRFLSPDVSLAVLDAFLGHLRDDTAGEGLDDTALNVLAAVLCNGMVACLLLGLVEELEARPAAAAGWADTGRALLAGLSAFQAVLRDARGRISRSDRGFLEGYHACGWDQARMAKRVKASALRVHGRCAEAMLALGGALRKELEGARS